MFAHQPSHWHTIPSCRIVALHQTCIQCDASPVTFFNAMHHYQQRFCVVNPLTVIYCELIQIKISPGGTRTASTAMLFKPRHRHPGSGESFIYLSRYTMRFLLQKRTFAWKYIEVVCVGECVHVRPNVYGVIETSNCPADVLLSSIVCVHALPESLHNINWDIFISSSIG